ncbi:hypothetical protein M378DRAFT_160408 [Amanita muscaria Koide BX008]|uniref:Uncharacterized protein n=1 Tax=Amanita muscaria (strain Koide BX008) TaxID=946122 RepID=A0A0C2SU08_AMAMK|nr:hypothetical protein M378DRAFT_160408 [Amanita muscaria Koide BX008]
MRICLRKDFALTELKAGLSVLIRNYTFELPDGPSCDPRSLDKLVLVHQCELDR